MDLSEEQFASGTSSLSELVMSHEYRKNMPKVRFLHHCARNIRSTSTSLPLQIDGFASVRSHRLPGFRVWRALKAWTHSRCCCASTKIAPLNRMIYSETVPPPRPCLGAFERTKRLRETPTPTLSSYGRRLVSEIGCTSFIFLSIQTSTFWALILCALSLCIVFCTWCYFICICFVFCTLFFVLRLLWVVLFPQKNNQPPVSGYGLSCRHRKTM